VISLGFIVLLTMLVTSYLVSMRLDRISTHNYSQSARAKELATGAMEEIVNDLKQEIEAGSYQDSSLYTVNGTTIYAPLTAVSSQPARLGFDAADFGNDVDRTGGALLPPTVLRVSRSGDDLYQGLINNPNEGRPNYDADLLPANRTSAVSTTEDSLNRRRISPERWNQPKLMGTTVPSAFTDNPPEWIYVTRDGSRVVTEAEVDTLKPSTDLDETSQVLGRYAFVIYSTGSLLDINAAGYPSDLTEDDEGKLAIRNKGALAYADLTALPGMAEKGDDIDELIAWRNKGALAALSDDYLAVVDEGQKEGFLKFQPDDSPLLSRQDLLAYFEEKGLPEEALPYLTTFTRSVNAPSWGPRQNSPGMLGYQAGMGTDVLYRDNAETATAANRNLFNVRFSDDATVTHYGDEMEAATYEVKEGDPLLQSRFSLARLGWLDLADPDAGTGPAASSDQGKAIQAAFGLVWDYPGVGAGSGTTANGGNPCWNYVGSTGNTAQGRIKTLAEVAAENREPNFFELLKAVILSGSLGKSPGEAAFNNGTESVGSASSPNPYDFHTPPAEWTLGPAGLYCQWLDYGNMQVPAPAQIPDMQIIRIGANIIDQYDADSYPTAIYFKYDGVGSFDPALASGNLLLGPVTMAYGTENLPYLTRILQINVSPTRTGSGQYSNSNDDDTSVMGGWRQPELWSMHQQPAETPAEAPNRFQVRAYGAAQTYWIAGNSKGDPMPGTWTPGLFDGGFRDKGVSHVVSYYGTGADANQASATSDVGTINLTVANGSDPNSAFYAHPLLLRTNLRAC